MKKSGSLMTRVGSLMTAFMGVDEKVRIVASGVRIAASGVVLGHGLHQANHADFVAGVVAGVATTPPEGRERDD